MKIRELRHRWVGGCILAGVAVVLVWLVISKSLVAYLADAAPRSALCLDPRDPEALLNLADRAINRSKVVMPAPIVPDQIATKNSLDIPAADSENANQAFNAVEQNPSVDLPKVRLWAEAAATRAPLSARALSVLGQLASISNDDRDASKYMAAAARLSLHETTAVYWMMSKSTATHSYERALFYADALLRTNPDLIAFVEPLLAYFAEQKSSNGFIKVMLAANPPWRDAFFSNLPRYISDARTPLDLLLALRTSRNAPSADEINGYLDFLVSRKFYDLAYYTWLQFLPPKLLRTAGLLFNGGFETAPSGSPFDWAITQGSGVTVDIVPTPGNIDARALLVSFLFGRVDYHSVGELVVLAPGTYRFTAQYKGKLVGPRGLKWRLACADDAQTRIGESPMIIGAAPTWQDVGFDFTVPATNCRAQRVRLDLDARTASENLVSGSVLFNALHIARIESPATAQQSTR